MRRIVYVGCLVVACSGCGSGSGSKVEPPKSDACGSVVAWHGTLYYGHRDVTHRARGGSLGLGSVASCTDVLGGETGASRAVDVRRLVGVEPDFAIVVAGEPDHVYVAGSAP